MNNLPVERPDTIASVSPPEPLGAGGGLMSPWGPGAQFSLRKLRRFVEFESQFVFIVIFICRLCPGRPGLRKFHYEKLNSTIIGGNLTFELLQLCPALCGIAINHISFVLLLDSAFALFPLPF